MKKWLRIICLVLVIACIMPCIVACGDGNGKNNEVQPNKEPPKTVSGDTYKNSTFTIYSVEDMFAKQYFFADKVSGDGMNDALYQRQINTKGALDVELVYKAAAIVGEKPAFQVYADEVKNSIASGMEKYQLVLTHSYYALPDLINDNLLIDMKELTSVKAGMEQTEVESYWNTGIMDEVSYNGHYYLGYSDFNLARTYVIAFNKNLYLSFESAFKGKTMYDYVKSGEWTLSQMEAASKIVYEDKGDVSTDTYGLTGDLWVPFIGFVQSSGESFVTRTSTNGYKISFDNNRTVSQKLDKLGKRLDELDEDEETYFWINEDAAKSFSNRSTTKVDIASGRAFMQLMSTNELIALKDQNVKFGVLPYPKYDKDQQEYRSLNWAGYLAVPSNISNKAMVSDVIECLSFYSDDVTRYYYEKLLGLKVSEAVEDEEMLDYVWDSLCSDFGVAFCMIDSKNIEPIVYSIPRSIHGNQPWATFVNGLIFPAGNALKKINQGE